MAPVVLPRLPVTAVKTYQIVAPVRTHHRKATCAEVNCQHYLHGWRTILPANDTDMLTIARRSGRRCVETRLPEGLIEFAFEAGQPCFRTSQHMVRIDKPELFVVRGGDWRGNPRGEFRTHTGPDQWLDDFANHQDRLKTAADRG